MTPAPDALAPELDALTITIVVDNATDTLSSIGPGVPQLPEMAYLLGAEPMGQHDGHNCVVTLDHLCVACHGFSALAEARAGDQVATVLFDVGPYGDVWLANAERLSVDLAAIDVLFLSHWHWDHSGGIPTVVEAIAAARSRAGRPPLVVDVHPDRPDQRGVLTPLDVFSMLPPEPAIDAIGAQVVAHANKHPVAGLFLSSGDIPRRTSYETGLAGHHTWRDGQVTLDLEIHDERFLAANVAGRGTTVLTACSHAGVVNVGLDARDLFRTSPSTCSSAAITSPGPASRIASNRLSATSRPESSRGSSHRGTAPAGELPQLSPRRSLRAATHPASSAPATC